MSWINICDIVYPIGSVYISYDPTSPSEKFGGSWESIVDNFLYPRDPSSTTAGTTGGESSVKLYRGNMPSNFCSIAPMYGEFGNYWDDGWYTTSDRAAYTLTTSIATSGYYRSWYLFAGNELTPNYGYGGGTAHNNIPNYVTVFAWKRTA